MRHNASVHFATLLSTQHLLQSPLISSPFSILSIETGFGGPLSGDAKSLGKRRRRDTTPPGNGFCENQVRSQGVT